MFNPNLEVLWRPSLKPFPGKDEHVAWFEIFIVDIFKRTNSKTVRRFRITFLRHRRIDWWGLRLQTVAFKHCFPVKARLVLASKTVAKIRALEAAGYWTCTIYSQGIVSTIPTTTKVDPKETVDPCCWAAKSFEGAFEHRCWCPGNACIVVQNRIDCHPGDVLTPATYRLIEYDISLGLEDIQKDINNIIVKCRTARHSETTS